MCAGCAAAIGNNGVGVAGVGWNFNHRVGRVTDDPGGGASSAVLADCARKMCELSDVKVASVSYSGVEGSTRRQAATYCKTQGALMTNAAGNDNRNLSQYGDANTDDLIVVGASTSSNNKASFSAYGSFVDVWAPGQSVWTTTVGNSYQAVSGTSFSCPLTAGLIALIWSKNPELTPNEVETILKSSTNTDNTNINIGDVMSYGTAHGLIDSFSAVMAAGSGTTDSPVTPAPSKAPITQAPSKAPITDAPTSCNLGAEGQRCNVYGSGNTGCCSGVCESFGNPARRVCLSNNGPTTPAPTPTPSVTQNSPEPTGSCLAKNNQCTLDDDCCTKNCKNNGRCS